MRKVSIIGIGAGDPEQVTVQAVRALNEVDVFFMLDKGVETSDLVAVRQQICDRYIERPYRVVVTDDPERDLRGASYGAAVQAWHEQRVDIYERLIGEELDDGQCGALLVWGDPSLYDSTLRILDQVAARGTVAFEVEVIPGISSVQVLAARHRIPLHGIGEPVRITTGRQLAAGWPDGAQSVVVMLDGSCAFKDVDPEGTTIYWGAYLGMEDELLIAGPLAERSGEIQRVRAEARARKGWMFDTYLLRRAATVSPPAPP